MSDSIALIAPHVLRHEVARAILNATRNRERPRITPAVGQAAVATFLAWPIRYFRDEAVVLRAYAVAERLHVSYFDSLYLTLAEETGFPFLHADAGLRRALGGRFPLAVWLEDYASAS